MDIINFTLLFVGIQYLLCTSEVLIGYNNIVSDIQKYKFKFFHNEAGDIALIRTFIYVFGYLIVSLFVYRYVFQPGMKYMEAFLFVSFMYTLWDVCYLQSFDRALTHIPEMLYDIFVVGGLGIVSTLYIINNFSKKINTFSLLVFYLASMCLFLYTERRDELT